MINLRLERMREYIDDLYLQVVRAQLALQRGYVTPSPVRVATPRPFTAETDGLWDHYVAVILFRRLFDNSCRSSETSVQMSLTDIFASKAFVAFVDKIPEDVAGGLACFAGGALAGGALGLAVSTATATTSVAARGGGGGGGGGLSKVLVEN